MKRLAVLLCVLILAGCAQSPKTVTTPETTSGRSDPANRARVHTDLAAYYYTRAQYSIALNEIQEALASESNYAPAYNILALINTQLREDKAAEEAFRKAVDLAPTYSEARNNFGYFLCTRERYDESMPMFEAAIRNPLYASPEKPLANAGLCALHKGDVALAQSYLQRALARARNQPTALLGMAELELRLRNPHAAKAYLKTLTDQNEFKPQVLWLAVRVERALGNREAEASYGAQLRRDHPGTVEMRQLLEGQYDRMGAMP
jgi:type IV pilus assembly protein PilF